MNHWQRFGMAWLLGITFFVVTNAVALESILSSLTHAEIAALDRLDWAIIFLKTIALSGGTILAYLNQTYAKATGLPAPDPKLLGNSSTPTPP